MASKRNSKNYKQNFRKEWKELEHLKKWLLEVPGEPAKAMCKYCKCTLRAKLSDLNDWHIHGSS